MTAFFTKNELVVSQLFGELKRNIDIRIYFLCPFWFLGLSLHEGWQSEADFG